MSINISSRNYDYLYIYYNSYNLTTNLVLDYYSDFNSLTFNQNLSTLFNNKYSSIDKLSTLINNGFIRMNNENKTCPFIIKNSIS